MRWKEGVFWFWWLIGITWAIFGIFSPNTLFRCSSLGCAIFCYCFALWLSRKEEAVEWRMKCNQYFLCIWLTFLIIAVICAVLLMISPLFAIPMFLAIFCSHIIPVWAVGDERK